MGYLLLKDAATNTGKDEKTIRRLVKKPESTGFTKKVGAKLYIQDEYLYSIYPLLKASNDIKVDTASTQNGQALVKAKDETIDILRLEVNQLHNTINDLIERNREQNIIIQSLQDKIRLLPAPTPPPSEEVDSVNKNVSNSDLWIKVLVGALLAFMAAASWYIFR